MMRGLQDGLGMFWDTLWALLLGFTLSGVVQAFVSRDRMRRALGDHRPRTVIRASLWGMASSSCSYAASALAKTLFARGADFTASQVFMFASTNLVVELGAVLWLLLGWQFAAAEFVGGAIMIALLSLVLPALFRDTEPLRLRLPGQHPSTHDAHGAPAAHAAPAAPSAHAARWADAAGYTVGDLTMLRRELVLGFLVAGYLDTAVPLHFWRSLFVSGHGFASAVENAVLGPFLALISCVCSVGNVPLAASIWSGGASFGGVVAFVFADLVALPLLAIYRRYYGARVTLRLLGVFWATMSVAGLLTQGLFSLTGLEPHNATGQHGKVGVGAFGWNYTTVLDVIALLGFAALYLFYRRQRATTAETGRYAKDPVCGMQVEVAHAPASLQRGDVTYYFCSDHCRARFARSAATDAVTH